MSSYQLVSEMYKHFGFIEYPHKEGRLYLPKRTPLIDQILDLQNFKNFYRRVIEK